MPGVFEFITTEWLTLIIINKCKFTRKIKNSHNLEEKTSNSVAKLARELPGEQTQSLHRGWGGAESDWQSGNKTKGREITKAEFKNIVLN